MLEKHDVDPILTPKGLSKNSVPVLSWAGILPSRYFVWMKHIFMLIYGLNLKAYI